MTTPTKLDARLDERNNVIIAVDREDTFRENQDRITTLKQDGEAA